MFGTMQRIVEFIVFASFGDHDSISTPAAFKATKQIAIGAVFANAS
ncbi:hypothetical protein SD77_3601 [Bacillus badius]|uniref:Uncharacterized protein n=1 Tax=Bacillus badius TaxID=1455 RepID=A0ABR5ANK2_BACBA|nr:hypothetical protein SD77_3601 [Bacillus badius]